MPTSPRRYRASKIPGIAVAIVRNDSVLYTKGFGVLAAGSTTPVDDQTLFEIGSSSKSFTATLVAMMVADGKMRYDDRITQYLPDFKLYDPLASAELTVRDALTHRAGLSRGELIWLGSGATRAEVLHRVRFLKPQSPFRSRYSYQNIMVLAAGEAAGKAAGTSWDDLLKQRIFVPLGMRSSVSTMIGLPTRNFATPHGMVRRLGVREAAHEHGQHRACRLHHLQRARHGAVASVSVRPTASTTASDSSAAPRCARPTRRRFVMVAAVDAVARRTRCLTSHFSTYGMGWIVEDYRKELVWQHGGNHRRHDHGHGCDAGAEVRRRRAEQHAQRQLPAQLMRYIFDRQLNAPATRPGRDMLARAQRQRRTLAQSCKLVRVQPENRQCLSSAFVGTYADSMYGEATVSMKDGRLELVRGEWRGPLEYWNATNFRWTVLPSSPTGPMYMKFESRRTTGSRALFRPCRRSEPPCPQGRSRRRPRSRRGGS
jgi:hypothetical protein